MATTKKPEEILASILSNGNAPNPQAQLDTAPWTPTYSSTPDQQAQNQANLEYDPKIQQLQEAARQSAATNDRSRSIEQGYGQEVDPRLANVYSALGNSLTQRRGETQGNYEGAVNKIRGYYDEATGANQGVNRDALDRITESAGKLGLGAAVPDATKRLMEDYQFSQNQLSQGKAGRSANLTSLASEIYGLDTNRIGASAQEGAQDRSGAQQQVLKTLSDLMFANQQEQSKYRSEVTGLEGDKSSAIAQLVSKFTDQRSKDGVEARGNALQELLQRSGLENTNRSFEENKRQSDRQFDEGQRQFNEQIRQSNMDRSAANARASSSSKGRGGGSSSNPLNDMLKMLQIEQLQGKLGTKNLKGREGLDIFLKSSNPYWGKDKKSVGPIYKDNAAAGPKFQGAILDIITLAGKGALPRGANLNTGASAVPARDEYKVALSYIYDKKGNPRYPKMNTDALRDALEIYYKGRDFNV